MTELYLHPAVERELHDVQNAMTRLQNAATSLTLPLLQLRVEILHLALLSECQILGGDYNLIETVVVQYGCSRKT